MMVSLATVDPALQICVLTFFDRSRNQEPVNALETKIKHRLLNPINPFTYRSPVADAIYRHTAADRIGEARRYDPVTLVLSFIHGGETKRLIRACETPREQP